MQDVAGSIHGLQIVRGRVAGQKQRRLEKEFWPAGLVKKGHFHQLGMVAGAQVLLVAEGYATAATLYEATGLPVAVAFDAGNLEPVAKALREKFPNAAITICADNDHQHTRKSPECTELWNKDVALLLWPRKRLRPWAARW